MLGVGLPHDYNLDIPLEQDFLMKDPLEVLRSKEQEIDRVKKEVDALRVVAELLADENDITVEKIRKVIEWR